MTILKILQYPDMRLRRQGYQVKDTNAPEIKKIIADMLETLAHTEHCAGLSATQLDLEPAPSITVINSSIIDSTRVDEPPICLINPELINCEGSQIKEEGCMSVYPEIISSLVPRYTHVKVKALDHLGNKLEINATDLYAVCLQHEIDHLNGILYIDKISALKRSRIEKKIAKLTSKS